MSGPDPSATERLHVSVATPAGELNSQVEVPSGFVPLASLVPTLRRLGEEAIALEETRAVSAGHAVSCRKGCAACCRMLVPVSPAEALALREVVEALPEAERRRLDGRLGDTRRRLEQAGLWSRLIDLAETDRQLSDRDFEQTNQDYYALRQACPFLESEVCSIYHDRPAACRELLVVSPAELCEDFPRNPVRPLSVPLRIGTVLSMLWAELVGGPVRLIPLPVALSWAERHAADGRRSWSGLALFERAMEQVWRYLSQSGNKT